MGDMSKLDLDLLALRVRRHVTFREDGKPTVRLSQLSTEDRTAVFEHADALRRLLAPELYHRGKLIREEQIIECMEDGGTLTDYHTGKLSKRRALRQTKAWLRQAAELEDLRWRGRDTL